MSHYMVAGGPLDHAFPQCPHFQREQREAPGARVFIDDTVEHGLDIDHPWEMQPFGLCGWCWRVYLAKRPLTKALIRHGVWEPEPEAFAGYELSISHHLPGVEQSAYWGGRIVSP